MIKNRRELENLAAQWMGHAMNDLREQLISFIEQNGTNEVELANALTVPVEEIEYTALERCLSLTEIIILDNNKSLYMENGGLYNKRRTVFYRLFLAEADTYVLLDGIEKIKGIS